MKQISNSKNPIVTSSNENNLPYIVVQISGAFVDSYGLDTTQLEIGDTATPYEPYHEPITTPIYLDSPLYKIGDYADSINYAEQKVERVVKELVLTGNEKWYTYSTGAVHQFYTQGNRIGGVASSSAYSTIAPYGMMTNNRNGNYGCYTVINGDEIAFQMYGSKADFPTQTEWKAYLAAQYAAGTPVKVYYVLATPETESVILPKIPTLDGTTVIDVDTAVKPESMTIKYRR